MKIGVLLPSLAEDFFASDDMGGYYCNFKLDDILTKVQKLGIKGLQTYNVGSEMDPSVLTDDDIENLKKKFASLGITVTAFLAAMDFVGEYNYSQKQAPERLKDRVQKFNDILELGIKLGAPIATTESGIGPEDEDFKTSFNRFMGAMADMVDHAEKVNGFVGLELGPGAYLRSPELMNGINTPDLMDKVMKGIDSDHLKINLDPANIIMSGFDPVEYVYRFADKIIHTHAKDAIRYPDRSIKEVPLGQGMVPWPRYLRALKDIGYTGWLTIEREVGDDVIVDIRQGKEFLEKLLEEVEA